MIISRTTATAIHLFDGPEHFLSEITNNVRISCCARDPPRGRQKQCGRRKSIIEQDTRKTLHGSGTQRQTQEL